MTESLSKFYQLILFRDQVMAALGNPDEAIAKIKELSEQSQLLSEIGDILRMANAECLDHRRFKQEEKIVVTGFRRLCDIHLALFGKRSEYEIYGSRIINDLLNSVDLQAQKQAYDQEEIKFRSQIKQALYEGVRKDKYPSIDEFPDDDAISFVEHLIDRHKHWGRDHEFTQFALEVKQLLIDSVGKDISNEEAIAEIEQLTGDKDREIKRLNGDISGIASFLNLPSDAKQPDICFAIMELKQEKKKYYKGYFQLEVISKYLKLPENCKPMDITTEVIELKEEMDQAKKIIARLVGK
jgi:hypothetical protein